MALYKILSETIKQLIEYSVRYFIPVTLLLHNFLQNTANASMNISNDRTQLIEIDSINNASPSLAYFMSSAEMPQYDISHDSALSEYLVNPNNTYDYIVNIDTSKLLEQFVPRFFTNQNAFCQVHGKLLIQNPEDCRDLDAEKLNLLYQKAREFGRKKLMVDAVNVYNDMLKLIPANDPYYNPLFKLLYWHIGSTHFFLRNLDQAKRSLELAIALATDTQYLGMIYSKYGIILNMQEQHERAYLAHQKSLELMPNDEDALSLLHATQQLMNMQSDRGNPERFDR